MASDDIMNVRKLINLWVRVDLVKGCKTLKELALDKGTENIIRLIKDIEPSMVRLDMAGVQWNLNPGDLNSVPSSLLL